MLEGMFFYNTPLNHHAILYIAGGLLYVYHDNYMANKEVKSLDELKKLRKPVVNPNSLLKDKFSKMELVAVWITDHVGTMGFFMIILIWTITWLGWNILAPKALQFDPYPAFVLWLFISNMIQIFLMPLIMIGQNLQGRHSELRAEADFEVNIKAEREIETILSHLENQNELIIEVLSRLDKSNTDKMGHA
jgi:uncharacterized membrane protein